MKDEHIIRQRNHSLDTPHLSPSYCANPGNLKKSDFFGRNDVFFNFTFKNLPHIYVQVLESEHDWVLAFMTWVLFASFLNAKRCLKAVCLL